MTSETEQSTSWWTVSRTATVVLVAVLLAVAGWGLVAQQNESNRRTDVLYCTLSGVGLGEHGPETGELCADLLYGD